MRGVCGAARACCVQESRRGGQKAAAPGSLLTPGMCLRQPSSPAFSIPALRNICK